MDSAHANSKGWIVVHCRAYIRDGLITSKTKSPYDVSDTVFFGSHLDDAMRIAFQDLRDVMKNYPLIKDYRTAAYAIAITKIAQSFYNLGLSEQPHISYLAA